MGGKSQRKGSKSLKDKFLFFLLIIFLGVCGCGTNVKPRAFVDIVKDGSDIDQLSASLSQELEVSDSDVNCRF